MDTRAGSTAGAARLRRVPLAAARAARGGRRASSNSLSCPRARSQRNRANQAVRRGAELRGNIAAAVDRRVDKRVEAVETKVSAQQEALVACAAADVAAARRERDEANARAAAAECRARDVARDADAALRRATRRLTAENTELRRENFALKVLNSKLIAEVAAVRL